VFQFGLTVLWDDPDGLVTPGLYHFTVAEVRAPYREQLARYRTTLFWWFGLLFAALIAAQLVILAHAETAPDARARGRGGRDRRARIRRQRLPARAPAPRAQPQRTDLE
jgi:hypothetical protein